MLNSGEYESSNAKKEKDVSEIRIFIRLRKIFFPLINVEMPTAVGIFYIYEQEKFYAQLS